MAFGLDGDADALQGVGSERSVGGIAPRPGGPLGLNNSGAGARGGAPAPAPGGGGGATRKGGEGGSGNSLFGLLRSGSAVGGAVCALASRPSSLSAAARSWVTHHCCGIALRRSEASRICASRGGRPSDRETARRPPSSPRARGCVPRALLSP